MFGLSKYDNVIFSAKNWIGFLFENTGHFVFFAPSIQFYSTPLSPNIFVQNSNSYPTSWHRSSRSGTVNIEVRIFRTSSSFTPIKVPWEWQRRRPKFTKIVFHTTRRSLPLIDFELVLFIIIYIYYSWPSAQFIWEWSSLHSHYWGLNPPPFLQSGRWCQLVRSCDLLMDKY